MKKIQLNPILLLYLIPILLAILSLSPLALEKDTVGLSLKPPVLQSLSPSDWSLINLSISASNSPNQNCSDSIPADSNPPLSTNASFKGFPFGAYFSRTITECTGIEEVSAWSWLWAIVDGLLILVTLIIAIFVNKRQSHHAYPLPAMHNSYSQQPQQMNPYQFSPVQPMTNQVPPTTVSPSPVSTLPAAPVSQTSVNTPELQPASWSQPPNQPTTESPLEPQPINPDHNDHPWQNQ